MAKLHSYYVLCPLIDQKSFLGVSEDKENDHAIVTLSRNVVNKYRLADQKQTGGWTSKDHICAAVIYDEESQRYVGVFNSNTIKVWNDNDKNLEKLKKYKFTTNILKLVPRKVMSPLVIFTNGNCSALSYALDNRKTNNLKPVLKAGDTIVDVTSYILNNTEYICYIVKNNKGSHEILVAALRAELGDIVKHKVSRVNIERADCEIIGKKICVSEQPAVYVIYNDSKLHIYDLSKETWKVSGSVPWISSSSSVSLEWMGESHLILFGSNSEQDGAIIIAYNIILGVGSYRYPLKMYCEDAKVYSFSGKIILEASNHLGMLPYVLETSRSLSSLLETHRVSEDVVTDFADWGVGEAPTCDAEGDLLQLLKKGVTERTICSQVLPDLVEKSDWTKLLQIIKQFDVPENIIVSLLKTTLSRVKHENFLMTNMEEFNTFCNENQRVTFLNEIFKISFCDASLIPHLRGSLNLNEALFLLTYISHLLGAKNEDIFEVEFERKLLDWCTMIMDAFYQQYVISTDTNVTKSLDFTRNIVNELIDGLNEINEIVPLLNTVLCSNDNYDDVDNSLPYTIEVMKI